MHPWPDLAVVFARCAEPGVGAARALSQQLIPFHVYQKGGTCNSSSRAMQTLAQIGALPGAHVRHMERNAGDECAAYLQYVADEYERLPSTVVFLQYGAEYQLALPSAVGVARLAHAAVARRGLGFVALGRHSFEGLWPAPCEAPGKQATFRRCSERIWRDDLGVAPPRAFRFYANGLFGVSRERVRKRPRAWYTAAAARLTGDAPARCDGPDTRRRPGAASRLVGDCHVLEKAWHIVFGEPSSLPPAVAYDALRAPNQTLRQGGRFYERTPRGSCTAGTPPAEILQAHER